MNRDPFAGTVAGKRGSVIERRSASVSTSSSREARPEKQTQLLHFEALDSKAGVLLGFAGPLVALAPDRADRLIVIGRFLAVVSGMSALGSFWPRDCR